MKKIYLLLASLLPVYFESAAQYSTDWIRPAEDYMKTGVMIARDNSDKVIVTGFITSNKIFTRKYDRFGNFQWEKFSESGIQSNYEKPRWVNCDQNNNVLVTGYRYSVGSGWEYPSAVVVLKYNSSGILQWKQIISLYYVVGSSSGFSFNLKSEMDNNGNLYIGTAGTSPSGFVMLKLNTAGTVLVNSTINMVSGFHGFGSMRLKGNKMIVTGRSFISNYNATVVAWDTSGTFLWSKTLVGVFGNDVDIDDSGNSYILTSYPNQVSPTSGYDVLIYKLNTVGAQLWVQNYDFGGQEFANRLTFVADKLSVIAYGTLSPSLYTDWVTFQTNASGAKLWDARYSGTNYNDERSYFLSAKATGEVFVTGIGGPTPVPNQLSWLRMVTLKYSSTGVLQWIDTLNTGGGNGLACTLASDGSLFVLSASYMTAYHFLDHTGAGSCDKPATVNASNISDRCATFNWAPMPGAYLYHLRYKTTTANGWTTISTNLLSKSINSFTQGTAYQYAVEAVCGNGPSGFTVPQAFTTTGISYCNTGGQSTSLEYLNLVWIGTLQNGTGNNNGYADYTNLSVNLLKGSAVSGYLRGTLGGGFTEYYRVWIDYNHNNVFTDPGEEVASISSSSIGYNVINFTVPLTALSGITRMRVTMQYGSAPSPCGSYPRGETEDYSVFIMESESPNCADGIQNGNETGVDCGGSCFACFSGGPLPVTLLNFRASKTNETTAELYWHTVNEINNRGFEIQRSFDGNNFTDLKFVNSAGNSSSLKEYRTTDVPGRTGRVYYRLNQIDLDGNSKQSGIASVLFNHSGMIQVFPNPAKQQVTVEGIFDYSYLQILDAAGKQVKTLKTYNQNQVNIDLTGLGNGIYLIRLLNDKETQTIKLIINK